MHEVLYMTKIHSLYSLYLGTTTIRARGREGFYAEHDGAGGGGARARQLRVVQESGGGGGGRCYRIGGGRGEERKRGGHQRRGEFRS